MKTFTIGLSIFGLVLTTMQIGHADVNEAKSTANTAISGGRSVKNKSFSIEPRLGMSTIQFKDSMGMDTTQTSNTALLGAELFLSQHISLAAAAETTFNHVEPSGAQTAQFANAQASINSTNDIWNRNYQASYGIGANYATMRDQSSAFGYENLIGPMLRGSIARVFSDLNSITLEAQAGNVGLTEKRFALTDYFAKASLDYRFRLFSNTQGVIGLNGSLLEVRQDNFDALSKTLAVTAGLNI